MRPVLRGSSPRTVDFANYRDAFPEMASRLGQYCSYCERRIATNLAIEHIQPKDLYPSLEGSWANFLLGCVNCNSTKGKQDVVLADVFLPDRDNTFVAFEYRADGTVAPASTLNVSALIRARRTLALVGLDTRAAQATDSNDRMVAIDRVKQRMEAWATAESAREDVDRDPTNSRIRRLVAVLALATGFFSIWMKVFEQNALMRNLLIDAFSGTRESGCFDAVGTPVSPSPNLDGLEEGGKI